MAARSDSILMSHVWGVLLAACAVAAATPAVGQVSLREEVEAAAIPVAQAQVAAPDRFEVASSRFGGSDAADEGSIVLEAIEAVGPNASGNVQVRFRVLVDGLPDGEARAVVRGRVLGPALQAARTLTRGRVIGADDVELRESDLTRLRQPPLRRVEDLRGRVPVRTLGVSRVLSDEQLTAAAVVHRGQTVEVKFRKSRLSVRALATALRDGAPGEVVPAKNQASGVVIQGTVQPDGTLLVGGTRG